MVGLAVATNNKKEQMIPYVPTWEAHNTSAHNLVGKFTKAYPRIITIGHSMQRVG